MKNCCNPSNCSQNDFTGRKTAWFLWYVPIAILVVGSSWTRGRVWVCVPALVVMGLGCTTTGISRHRKCHVTCSRIKALTFVGEWLSLVEHLVRDTAESKGSRI